MTSSAVLSSPQLRFLAASRTAALATRARDGTARLVPICFIVVPRGEPPAIVTPLDEKPKAVADPRDLERVRDILAEPHVDLLLDRWSEDWTELAWLRLSGRASLLEPGDPTLLALLPALRAKYPQYEAHRLEDRPAIRIDILAARSWGRLEP